MTSRLNGLGLGGLGGSNPFQGLIEAGVELGEQYGLLLKEPGRTELSHKIQRKTGDNGVVRTKETRIYSDDPEKAKKELAELGTRIEGFTEKYTKFMKELGTALGSEEGGLSFEDIFQLQQPGSPVERFAIELAAEAGISVEDARKAIEQFVKEQKNRRNYERAQAPPPYNN